MLLLLPHYEFGELYWLQYMHTCMLRMHVCMSCYNLAAKLLDCNNLVCPKLDRLIATIIVVEHVVLNNNDSSNVFIIVSSFAADNDEYNLVLFKTKLLQYYLSLLSTKCSTMKDSIVSICPVWTDDCY